MSLSDSNPEAPSFHEDPVGSRVVPFRPGPVSSPIPTVTVVAVVDEAVFSVIKDRGDPTTDGTCVTHSPTAGDSCCSVRERCVPLGPILRLDGVTAGHLHRSVADVDQAAGVVEPHPTVGLDILSELVAARVGRDLLDVRLAQREHDVENLTKALESNRVIGVAVGIVMATRGSTSEQAFAILKTASQNQNRKLRDIAEEVEYTGSLPEPSRRSAGSVAVVRGRTDRPPNLRQALPRRA